MNIFTKLFFNLAILVLMFFVILSLSLKLVFRSKFYEAYTSIKRLWRYYRISSSEAILRLAKGELTEADLKSLNELK